MDHFLLQVKNINGVVNDFVWGPFGLILLIGTGILMTCLTGLFQFRKIGEWWKTTIGGVFKQGAVSRNNKEKGAVSQFQALCTALAATIGTGNIAGVAGAIVIGGPGAVFWMWMAALFGMMTNFSENVLGIYFRRKNSEGEWSGGAMYYLKDGLGKLKGCKNIGAVLAVLFSCFAVLASFGIGNMSQINTIVDNLKSAFFGAFVVTEKFESTLVEGIKIAGEAMKSVVGTAFEAPSVSHISIVSLCIGIVLMILAGLIILGGLQRIAKFAEKVVPFMAVVYILGALVICVVHYDKIIPIFESIFKYAFGVKAAVGGAAGIAIKNVIVQGCKRGVFSNEAGLGSSVMVHSNSNVIEPVRQGMWGIFEVFADTIVVCTMTAIVVLSSGKVDLNTGLAVEGANKSTLVAQAFGAVFGKGGEIFVALAVLLFAFTTVLGWSHYGSKSFEYLFGVKAAKGYKVFFVLLVVVSSIMQNSLAWDISDTFNGMMMLPNLIGVLALSPLVVKITKNYIERRIQGKKVEPIISAFPDIQKEQVAKLNRGEE